MTAGQDRPPLTRREARERERLLAEQGRERQPRRAATDEPIAAGEVPGVTSPIKLPVGVDRAFEPVLASSADDAASAGGSGLYHRSAATPEPLTTPLPLAAREEPRPAAAPSSEVPEHTLTRRELRAMLQAQEANRRAEPSEAETSREVTQREAPATPAVSSTGTESDPTPLPAAPVDTPVPAVPANAPVSVPQEGWPFAEDYQSNPSVAARDTSSTGTTTAANAFILPSFGNATGPLASTGEILVTGSIDLPHSLSSTGTHEAVHDSSEIDRLFDQPEEAVNTSEMSPVRASRAISSRAATSDIMPQQKSHKGRLPAILAGTAAVLAAGVAGLIVTGYVMGLL